MYADEATSGAPPARRARRGHKAWRWRPPQGSGTLGTNDGTNDFGWRRSLPLAVIANIPSIAALKREEARMACACASAKAIACLPTSAPRSKKKEKLAQTSTVPLEMEMNAGGASCLMLDVIPWDILVRAAIWLNVRDLGRLCCSSRQLLRLAREQDVWQVCICRYINMCVYIHLYAYVHLYI